MLSLRKGGATRKVRQARYKSGEARWLRLCKLALKNQGRRVVYAGISPHTSFSAALYSPAAGELRTIQGMLGDVGLKKPLGASLVLVQAVDRPSRSARFAFIK